METKPDMTMRCGVSAGIQTARIGGTTQTFWPVCTVITPVDANTSWCSG
jgi:hypothetical protein